MKQKISWPQIFELKRDLVRFLLSGEALNLENSSEIRPVGMKRQIWRLTCRISFYWVFRLDLFLVQGLKIRIRPG